MLVSFDDAAEFLKEGNVVGLPTETVYGLAGRIDDLEAIKKIFSTKERPFFDPLIVHVDSIEMAKSCVATWPDFANELAIKFWPGPLTIVLPKSEKISSMITSGLESVGLRIPHHEIFTQMIENQKCPLAAPSANKFGRVSPTSADHVNSEFNDQVPVVDGGPCSVGIESTVVLLRPVDQTFSVLRKGAISENELEVIAKEYGYILTQPESKNESPGHMKHHYMPSVPLVLIQSEIKNLKKNIEEKLNELPAFVEGVRLVKPSKIDTIFEMTLSQNPAVAARELYSELRHAANQGSDVIVFKVLPIHRDKSFEAVMERMTKAASLVL